MDVNEEVRRRSAQLRWRQGLINVALATLAAWVWPDFDPSFIVLGLFPFGILRLVQGTELHLGWARGGWTDIPLTPPVIGCWAAAAVFLQRLLRDGAPASAGWLLFWVALGLALYAAGRWAQQRYYRRRFAAEQARRQAAAEETKPDE